MKMNVLGKKKNYIQIGTVMTADKYRNKGLSRYLIEKIICEYKEKCDYIYLFANDTVLDFYPKFGFEKVNEYRYSISRVKKDTNIIANKLNIHNYEDKQLLESIIENSIVNSKLYVEENKNLIMFYCLGFLKECIYYIKEYNVIAICEYEDDTLNINDIFCNRKFDLEKVINVLIDDKTKRVNLGFTPIDIDGYRKNMLDDKNDTLFVLKDKENIFKNNYLMFPILSHA